MEQTTLKRKTKHTPTSTSTDETEDDKPTSVHPHPPSHTPPPDDIAPNILLALQSSSSLSPRSPRDNSPIHSSSSSSPSPRSPPSPSPSTTSNSDAPVSGNEESSTQPPTETKCMLNDCALCVRGVPMLLVRSPTWASIMRVVFYCLQYDKKDKAFFNLKTDIYGFIISHWNKLSLNKKRSDNWHKQIQDMLSHSKNLFESGMEKYKQNGFWRMKQNHDPWTMHKPRSYNWTKRANRSMSEGADSDFITVFDVTTGAVVQEGDIESPRKKIKGGDEDSGDEQSRHSLEDEIKTLKEALANMSENLSLVKEELKKKDQEMLEKAYTYQKTLEQLEALKLAHSHDTPNPHVSVTPASSSSSIVPPFNPEAFSAISPRNPEVFSAISPRNPEGFSISPRNPEAFSAISPRNITSTESYSPRNISHGPETYSPRNLSHSSESYSPRTSSPFRHLAPYPNTPPPSRPLEPAHYPSPPPTHLVPNFPPSRIFPPSFELSLSANNRRYTPPPLSFPPEGLSNYNNHNNNNNHHYPSNFPPPPSSAPTSFPPPPTTHTTPSSFSSQPPPSASQFEFKGASSSSSNSLLSLSAPLPAPSFSISLATPEHFSPHLNPRAAPP